MRVKTILLATACLMAETVAHAQTTTTPVDTAPPAGARTTSQDTPIADQAAPSLPGTGISGAAASNGTDIVVTGSRIRRDAFSASVPINTLDQVQLESAGQTNLAEVLADLPEVSLDQTPFGPTSGENQNSGLATVSLRNIGGNRTLTLIDGRRTVSNAANSNVVSINTIPIDFVERVEIITGAASAVYGSDGIAGVVNIITRNNYDGLLLSVRAGSTLSSEGSGGGEEVRFSGLYGRPFADGRGQLLLSATYEDDLGLKATDRDRSQTTSSFNYLTNVVSDPSLTNLLPGGWFNTTTAATSYFYNSDNVLTRGFVQNRDGFDIAPFLNLRVPRDSLSFAGKLRFEASRAFNPFVSVMYNELGTSFQRAPGGISSATQVYPRDPATGVIAPGTPGFAVGRIPTSNPFAPAAIREGATTTGIPWFRRFNELGLISFTEDRKTLRGYAGVNGKFGDGWFYEASYGYGDFRQNQLRENGINLLNLRNALTVQSNGDGGFQCTDAAARAAGCVPINLFGIGSITSDAADYIRANTTLESHLQQHVAQAYLTGSLFTLPAGDVSTAFGVEFRRDTVELESDLNTRAGYTTNAVVPSFNSNIEVKEAFGELVVPLLVSKPFFEELTLELAGRVGDYNIRNVGTVFSYRAGLSYAPVPGLRLRGQYGTAVRAPDLSELGSPPRDDINTILDPCSGITAVSPGAFAVNCRGEPGVAAAITANGVFTQSTTSISSPNSGNPDLREERAKVLTLGAVFQPAGLQGFSLSADYYDIKVADAIDSFSNDIILDQCYSSASFPSNAFCDVVTRSAETGQIQQVIQAQQNLNKIRASGIDVHADYRTRLQAIGLPGTLSFNADWTHLLSNETEYATLTGTAIEDTKGTAANPTDRVRARVGYAWEDSYIQWRAAYIGPFVSSNTRLVYVQANNIQDPLYLYYDSYLRHDLYVSQVAQLGDAGLKIYGGISNVFDDAGPVLPNGATPGAFSGYTSTYGVLGRTVFLGIEAEF